MAGRPKRGASGSTERNGYGEFKDGSPPPARRPRGAPRGDGTRTLLQRARAAADGALQRYVDRELAVCHYVQRRRHWLPFLARVTSGHPAHDATLGVWAVAAAACAAHGYALLFTLAANLAAAYLASRLLAARCPGDVDGGLVPLGRLSPWGLPSVEVWLSTTALGWVALGALEGAHAPAERAWVVAGCVLAWLVVIVTRVYGAAYFLWQLVVSVACGGMGERWHRLCCACLLLRARSPRAVAPPQVSTWGGTTRPRCLGACACRWASSWRAQWWWWRRCWRTSPTAPSTTARPSAGCPSRNSCGCWGTSSTARTTRRGLAKSRRRTLRCTWQHRAASLTRAMPNRSPRTRIAHTRTY